MPGYRAVLTGVGVLWVLMAASMFVQGFPTVMAGFGVPEEILKSPHYLDAMAWVYVHMAVLGVLMVTLGRLATEYRLRLWTARLLTVASAIYTFLDFRASDSPLGTGLYQGDASLIPAVMGLAFTLAFAYVALYPPACRMGSTGHGAP